MRTEEAGDVAVAKVLLRLFQFGGAALLLAGLAATPGFVATHGQSGRTIWCGALLCLGAAIHASVVLESVTGTLVMAIRPDVEWTPLPATAVPQRLERWGREFESLGLRRCTPMFRVEYVQPAVIMGFIDETRTISVSVFSVVRDGPSDTVDGFELSSRLDGERVVLRTAMTRTAGALPPYPGLLLQTFPGADVATCLARHREALEFLRARGLQPSQLDPEGLQARTEDALARTRAVIEAAPVRAALRATLRSLGGTRSAPIARQRAALEEIGRLTGRS